MKNNPKPSTIKGIVTREGGAKPKPHEYITAEALADSGYNVRFIPSSVRPPVAQYHLRFFSDEKYSR